MTKIELSKKIEEGLSTGDFFLHEKSGDVYILCFCEGKYFLACLNDGYHWHTPELKKENIFGDSIDSFVKITEPFTVAP